MFYTRTVPLTTSFEELLLSQRGQRNTRRFKHNKSNADLGTSFITFIMNTISFHFEQLDETNFHCQMKFLGRVENARHALRSFEAVSMQLM
jgi:hypothetical protein